MSTINKNIHGSSSNGKMSKNDKNFKNDIRIQKSCENFQKKKKIETKKFQNVKKCLKIRQI